MVVLIILLFAAGLFLVAHLDSYFRSKKRKPDEPTSGEDSDKDEPR